MPYFLDIMQLAFRWGPLARSQDGLGELFSAVRLG